MVRIEHTLDGARRVSRVLSFQTFPVPAKSSVLSASGDGFGVGFILVAVVALYNVAHDLYVPSVVVVDENVNIIDGETMERED